MIVNCHRFSQAKSQAVWRNPKSPRGLLRLRKYHERRSRAANRGLKGAWRQERITTVQSAAGISGQTAARAGWQILVAVICTTIATLAALALSFIIYLRPLLKELEKLSVTCRSAAETMERASAEFETTSKIMNKDLPTTLDSMERASLEFEELGQSLNILTGGLVRRNKPAKRPSVKPQASPEGVTKASEATALPDEDKPVAQIHEWNAVEALQAGTLASIRKVATDVSSLTAALAPAMLAWRKRLGFVLERVEEKPLPSPDVQPQLPAELTSAIQSAQPQTLSSPAAPVNDFKAAGRSLDETEVLKGLNSTTQASKPPSNSFETSLKATADQSQNSGPSLPESTLQKQGDKSAESKATSRSVLPARSAEEDVAEVMKKVTKAAITAAIETSAISPSGSERLDEVLRKQAKFQADKDEFSHHTETVKSKSDGSSKDKSEASGSSGQGSQEVMEISDSEVKLKPNTQQEASEPSQQTSSLEDGASPQETSTPRLTRELSRKEAAEAVICALENAEKAALAAAEASGQLEHALQNAERQAGVPKLGQIFSQRSNGEHSHTSHDGAVEGAYDQGMVYANQSNTLQSPEARKATNQGSSDSDKKK